MSNQPIIKAVLSATGAALGYVVTNASSFGKYAVFASILGTIAGYYVADILEDEFGSTTPSTA